MPIRFMFIFAMIVFAASGEAWAGDLDVLRTLPVLQDGRIKPFDTAARETLRAVSNCDSIDGKDAVDLIFDWTARPWDWEGQSVIYVGSAQLHDALHVPRSQPRLSPAALREAMQSSTELVGSDADELRERLATYDLAASGHLFLMAPGNSPTADWIDLLDADAELSHPWRAALGAQAAHDPASAEAALSTLRDRLWSAKGGDGGHAAFSPAKLQREVFYNRIQPFKIAAWAYGIALLLLGLSLMFRPKPFVMTGILALSIAVFINAGGFIARCTITGWAPVTNFFETVLWVGMISGGISVLMSARLIRRSSRQLPTAAACGALIGLIAAIVGANLPSEYGSSFRALPLALRTNFWLTLHVLTIVSSYGALAISMVAGNVLLAQASRGDATKGGIDSTARLVDRAVQIGLTLAIAGTLLGALWADMAWGRFWGWDPKEVWALIIILAYLALLHLRIRHRLDDIEMAAGATVCFATVLMSWYGVNFVLAAGMHSYGFEHGVVGNYLVGGYVIAQSVFTGWALARHRRRNGAAGVPRISAIIEDAVR
jgi:ABC-type transport system involved in cytochrome c biogenesis permease subunit